MDQPGLFEAPEPAAPVAAEEMRRSATFSDCRRYRYELTRTWSHTLPRIGFVMLNPSVADAELDDPTIRRCVWFTRAWGYGGFVAWNLYALCATDPRVLRRHPEPVGRFNDVYLRRCGAQALTIAAWGVNPMVDARAAVVVPMLRRYGAKLHHLGLTKDGYPKHPLARGVHRIPDSAQPIPWEVPA